MDTQVTARQMELTRWAGIISECRAQCSMGGMEVRQWLKENGISKDQYYYWHKKVRDADLGQAGGQTFCELSAPTVPAELPSRDVHTGLSISTGPFTISVPEDSARETLRMVLEEVSHVK